MKFFVAVLMAAALAGCARPQATSLVTGEHTAVGPGLGKTVVLTAFAGEETDAKGREKGRRIRELIEARFRRLPGTAQVDAAVFLAALGGRPWPDAADSELMAAARAAGIDTVALVEVASCSGDLTVTLPPFWSVRTRFFYRARLLDVRTGTLALAALRGRENEKAFWLGGREALFADFDTDLGALLAPVAATADRVTR